MWTGGIFVVGSGSSSEVANNVKLNNVYNLGNVTGKNAYYLGYRNGNTAVVEITNAYYSDTRVGPNITDIIGNSLPLSEMQSNTLVDKLNENLSTINLANIDSVLKDYTLSRWILGNNNYPKLATEITKDLSEQG